MKTRSDLLEKGIVIPIDDWRDFTGVGLGLLPRVEYRVSSRFALTVNRGLVFRLSFLPGFHGGSAGASTTEILVMGGIRYKLTSSLAVHGEAGANVRTAWADTRATDLRAALIVGTGYTFWRSWSVGANLFIPNLVFVPTEENVNAGIIVSLGHGFM